VANRAPASLLQMTMEHKSQSILISGESGAGKTEAMKIALTYIGEVSNKGGDKGGGGGDPVATRLMQTNPVMEAIGNAKTIRNNNSSRFGKHFDMQFNETARSLAPSLPSTCWKSRESLST
jgi:myosin heavy subunit